MPARTIITILSLVFGTALIASGVIQSSLDRDDSSPPAINQSARAIDTFETWRLPTAVPTVAPSRTPVATPGTETPPEPSPTPIPINLSPVARIEAPSIGVNADVVTLGLEAGGIMETPPDPVSVGWYDFSARPGATGNVVMAAHVDWANYGPAVFWELRNIDVGDQVWLTLEDGSSFAYQVESLQYYDVESAPVGEIVGATPNETLTLITCGGTFDRSIREYDKRLVVRAIRVI
jgi:LPXTG-site transpeptidase (sortase) family protein